MFNHKTIRVLANQDLGVGAGQSGEIGDKGEGRWVGSVYLISFPAASE